MKFIFSNKVKENLVDEMLLWEARKLQNGANVHCLANIMSAYNGACYLLKKKESEVARRIYNNTTKRLKDFIASGGKVCK